MNISEIAQILEAEIIIKDFCIGLDIQFACGSDMISDVMAFVSGNVLLLTGLLSPQVIRAAEMIDIKAVVFVRGKNPDNAIIEMAREKGITVLTTELTMFTACGKLYSAGIMGKGVEAL